MAHRRHKGRALARRYGRAWGAESAITQPAGGGRVNVVLVDSRGTIVGRPIARGVPLSLARSIIKRRHG